MKNVSINTATVLPIQKQWLSKREVKNYLDVSDEWIEEYLYVDLNPVAVGRKYFFNLSELNKWMEKHRAFKKK